MKTNHTFCRMTGAALRLSLGLTLSLGLSASLHAQPADAPCALRLATGPEGGVYARLARDIQEVCGKTVNVCAVPTKGGLQNLTMLSSSEVDIGFAQVDLLTELGRGGNTSIQQLQAVMPMHANLLHVVTLKRGSRLSRSEMVGNIWDGVKNVPLLGESKVFSKLSDLRKMKVAVAGSAVLSGQTLDAQLGYGMGFVEAANDDEALELLRADKVQAAFLTGGWPYKSISKQPSNSDLILAAADISVPPPAALVKRDYPNLAAYGVAFIAAPNLLLTRPFKAGGEKSRHVENLRRCIKGHMDELQEGDYSRVWEEIKDASDTMGIKRFPGLESVKVVSKN